MYLYYHAFNIIFHLLHKAWVWKNAIMLIKFNTKTNDVTHYHVIFFIPEKTFLWINLVSITNASWISTRRFVQKKTVNPYQMDMHKGILHQFIQNRRDAKSSSYGLWTVIIQLVKKHTSYTTFAHYNLVDRIERNLLLCSHRRLAGYKEECLKINK